MFFEKYLSHCHMTFQCFVIQRVKSVMNTVTDKKSVTLLCHIETDEVVLSTNYFMQITYMVNRVFQRVEQLISPSETTCFILLELLVSHGEIRSSIRQAPLFLSRMRKIKSIRFENMMINGKVMLA